MAKRPIRTKPTPGKLAPKGRRRLPATTTIKRRPLQDARQKLIQRKRSTVKDARDVLAKLAKGQDARQRLNKLRQTRSAGPGVKVIGSNILQKIDRDGNISLSTNKAKAAPQTAMNAAIQKQLGLIHTSPKKIVRRAPPTTLRRISPLQVVEAEPVFVNSVYKWTKSGSAASQLIGSLEGRGRGQAWQEVVTNRPLRMANTYVDLDAVDDEEMPMVPIKQTISLQGSSRISNIHSRLDSAPVEQETHGIFGQPKTKIVVPAGHRIVVSNLQATVTQDDVKELFEDIGQLLAARLVRPGVAEVIYKNLKDAQKAVDTYHNRQLDGQPMKCLLVNKRPLNNPTAPAISKMETQGITTVEVPGSALSNKLVPDLSTIHKVLFQRK